jgi:hypothetical protein
MNPNGGHLSITGFGHLATPLGLQADRTMRSESSSYIDFRLLERGRRFKTLEGEGFTSDRKQTKKVDIGWTRELWVFVNGKLAYADKNLFDQEGARKTPDGRCSLENGAFTLPLEAGDNEVAVAIANDFFGWGVMLRLADPEGVHPAAK